MSAEGRRAESKRKVSYMMRAEGSQFHFGRHHPMKPARINLTHDLVHSLKLTHHMDLRLPDLCKEEDFFVAHDEVMIEMMRNPKETTIERCRLDAEGNEIALGDVKIEDFGFCNDCPPLNNILDYCKFYSAGSLAGAKLLNSKQSDIAINWAGGMHHAKFRKVSGFCYVNDIAIAIHELLKVHRRVLYIDVDIHHGDGVEELFLFNNRVFTVSFHRYDGYTFFPTTGTMFEKGFGIGEGYSMNLPFKSGISDDMYFSCFKPTMDQIRSVFDPDVIVFQSGADSLAGDKLGDWSLTFNGHARLIEYVSRWNIPMLVLGGGGYTVKNVARLWALETAILCDKVDTLPQQIPDESQLYRAAYPLENELIPSLKTSQHKNENTAQYISILLEYTNIRNLGNVRRSPWLDSDKDKLAQVELNLLSQCEKLEQELKAMQASGM